MESHSINPKFQLITSVVTMGVILGLIINFLRVYCSHDEVPRLTHKDSVKISTSIKPINVEVGLHVDDFTKFKTLDNEFVLVGNIWFKYDKNEISSDIISKFDFKNGTIVEKAGPFFSYDDVDHKEIVYFDIRVKFYSDLFFYLFPFEDHRLYLMLVTNENIVYSSSNKNLTFKDRNMNVGGWHLNDKKVKEGYDHIEFNRSTDAVINNRPAIIFEFEFFMKGVRLLITILLPLLLVFLIELFSMCLDKKDFKQTLISISTANIGALMAYRFVIDNMTPKVGYLTLGDYFFFLFLTLIFLNFVVSNFGPYFSSKYKKIFSVILQLIAIFAFVYLLEFLSAC